MRLTMKKIVISLSVLFAISLLFANPTEIDIHNIKVYKEKQRSKVFFPHKMHMNMEYSCEKCHHFYVYGENILNENYILEKKPEINCSRCHWNFKIGKHLSLMDAYHGQCLNCHRENSRTGKSSGPQICAECHPKEKEQLLYWRLKW